MRAIFFKTLVMAMLVFTFFLNGCSEISQEHPDTSVNMTPRQISTLASNSFVDMIDEVRSCVVGISATNGEYYSVGSGVCVAEDGYILTNHHVVNDAQNLTVYFADKTQSKAEIIWSDSAIDLAIVKSERQIPYITFGDSDAIRVGEDAIAIGTPLTLQFKHTVTKGIISAKDRTLETDGENGTSYLQNLIQHDASINPGNSGGALISGEGKLIGINTLKATEAEGIGFAIPIKVGKAIVEKVSNNESYRVPYLGIFGFDATVAQYYGKTLYDKGIYVVSLDGDSPSAKAGLQKGDIITRVGTLGVDTMLDLRVALYNYNVGDRISLTISREGREFNIDFISTSRP